MPSNSSPSQTSSKAQGAASSSGRRARNQVTAQAAEAADRYIPGWMLWVHIPAFLPRHISFSQQFPNVGLVAVKSEPALFFLVRISLLQKQKTQFQLSSPIGTLPIRARPRLAWSVCEFARRRVATVGAEASMVREQCPLLAVRRRVNASGFRYPQNLEVWDAETESLS